MIDKGRIIKRQNVVQVFLDFVSLSGSDLADSLKGVYDIERLVSRVSFGKTNPKDLLQLFTCRLRSILETIESPALESLVARLDAIPELENLISSIIDPDALWLCQSAREPALNSS